MSSSVSREVLFRSDNLRATLASVGAAERPLVVTFDSLNHDLSLERAGFGEEWLGQVGYDAVHVIAARNDWYQHPETGEMLEAVRGAASGRPGVITYGSSMGGYAAIRFAEKVGAQTAVAISPQFSIDPGRAGFDTRWLDHGQRIAFLWEAPAAQDSALRTAWVFYDPKDLDRLHVEALAADYPIRPLAIRNGGHPVGGYLAETGLLASTVIAMIEGAFDPEAFAALVREARPRSGQYHFTMAHRQPPHRLSTALRLSSEAVRLSPSAGPYLSLHARLLEQAGDAAAAEALHHRAIALEPGYPRLRVELAAMLSRAGREAEAADLVREIHTFEIDEASVYARACLTLFLAGEFDAALTTARAGAGKMPHSLDLLTWRRILSRFIRMPVVGRPALGAARKILRRTSLRTRGRVRRWVARRLVARDGAAPAAP